MRTPYSYPAMLERDDDGRYVVRFPDLPEALTDGADEDEAIAEAADCLSEALASRIVDGEEIPSPTSTLDRYLVSPDPTIALKAALYMALRRHEMTVADLADRLGMRDWHQAARLIDPKRSSKLTRLATALDALGCTIEIAISDDGVSQDPRSTASAMLAARSNKMKMPVRLRPALERARNAQSPSRSWSVVCKRSGSDRAKPSRSPQILKPDTGMKSLRDNYPEIVTERTRSIIIGETLRSVRARRRVVHNKVDMHSRP